MLVTVGSVTDVGLKRQANEDSILVNAKAGVFAVCDGVGGRVGGSRASRLAVETIEAIMTGRQRKAPRLEGEILMTEEAVTGAHAEIRAEQRREPSLKTMATTVALLRLWDRYAIVAHVGDCRVELIRNDGIQRLTRDHSRVQQLVDRGEMTVEDAENSPERNVITRSLGVGESLGNIDIHVVQMYPGDTFVLASDGITSYVSEGEMFTTVAEQSISPQAVCERFKQTAYQGGAHDNLSTIVVRVEDDRADSISTMATMATPIV